MRTWPNSHRPQTPAGSQSPAIEEYYALIISISQLSSVSASLSANWEAYLLQLGHLLTTHLHLLLELPVLLSKHVHHLLGTSQHGIRITLK